MKNIALLSILSVLLLGNFLFAQAASPGIATVVAIRGKVEATNPEGEKRALQARDSIHEGDTIVTGPHGRVQLAFRDRSIVTLGAETTLQVVEYKYDPEAKQGAMVTRVTGGIFRIMGGVITKIAPEKFRTETSTANIGVRGSYYLGTLEDGVLKVAYLGGKGIYVQNAQGSLEIATPQDGALVKPGRKPQRIRFSTALLRELNAALSSPEGDGGAGDGSINNKAPDAVDPNGAKPANPAEPDQPGANGDPEPKAEPPQASLQGPVNLPVEAQQTTFVFNLSEPPAPADPVDPVAPVSVSGQYVATLDTTRYLTGLDGESTSTTLTAETDSAVGTGGDTMSFDFDVTADSSGAWTSTTRTIDLGAGSSDVTTWLASADNPADFTLWATPATTLTDGATFMDLGYAGVQTEGDDLPDSGVYSYSGITQIKNETFLGSDYTLWGTQSTVNFSNAKIVGFMSAEPTAITGETNSDILGIYFGTVNDDGTATVTYLGHGEWNDFLPTDIPGGDMKLTGTTSTSLTFYGTDGQGIVGNTSVGYAQINDTFTMVDQTLSTAQVQTGDASAADSGTATWQGFAIGNADGLIVSNTAASGLTLTIDADAGSVSGSMSVSDGTISLNDISVGGTGDTESAYVSDQALVALFDGYDSSFLYSAPEGTTDSNDDAFSMPEWAKWGYWAVAYDDAGATRYVDPSQGLWLAAENLVTDNLLEEANRVSGTGQYEGGAVCVHGDTTLSGTSSFTVNFTTSEFTGGLSFTGIDMAASGSVVAGGFSGAIDTVNASATDSSSLQGAFYNQSAVGAIPDNLAGSFSASQGTDSYLGIFAGNLTTP
jgi:hypothetical protein